MKPEEHLDLRQIEEFLKAELAEWKSHWNFTQLMTLHYDTTKKAVKWLPVRTLPRYISTQQTQMAFLIPTRMMVAFCLDTKTLQFPQLEYGHIPQIAKDEILEFTAKNEPMWRVTDQTKKLAVTRNETLKLHWDQTRYPSDGNFDNPFKHTRNIEFPSPYEIETWRERLTKITNRWVELERLTQKFEPGYQTTISCPVIVVDEKTPEQWVIYCISYKQLEKTLTKEGLSPTRHGGDTNWDQHTTIQPLACPKQTWERLLKCAGKRPIISLQRSEISPILELRPKANQDWS